MSKYDIREELYEYLEKNCKCNCEFGEHPWGCFDCQNHGFIPNSTESILICNALFKIEELEESLRQEKEI